MVVTPNGGATSTFSVLNINSFFKNPFSQIIVLGASSLTSSSESFPGYIREIIFMN
jgi:hypothetical protein